MEMQMKSVREVYRKINKKTGNATQINKNGVPGAHPGAGWHRNHGFCYSCTFLRGRNMDSDTFVCFHTEKNIKSIWIWSGFGLCGCFVSFVGGTSQMVIFCVF